MSETVRVMFKATPDLRKWKHRPATVGEMPFGHTTTHRLKAPVFIEDGEVFKTTTWERNWLVKHYPMNFSALGEGPSDPHDAAFNLDTCTYAQLQEAAKILGISAAGKEDVLRQRVRSALAAEKTKEE